MTTAQTVPSLARSTVQELYNIVRLVDDAPGSNPDPISGLAEQAELVFDMLHDSEIRRCILEEFRGITFAEEYHVRLADGSVINAIADWGADTIRFTPLPEDDG